MGTQVEELPKGTIARMYHNLFLQSSVPSRIFIVFVKQSAYNGYQALNPYNFGYSWEGTAGQELCYVEELKLFLSNKSITPISGNNTKKNCMSDYFRLQDTTWMEGINDCSGLTYDLFRGGGYVW